MKNLVLIKKANYVSLDYKLGLSLLIEEKSDIFFITT